MERGGGAIETEGAPWREGGAMERGGRHGEEGAPWREGGTMERRGRHGERGHHGERSSTLGMGIDGFGNYNPLLSLSMLQPVVIKD